MSNYDSLHETLDHITTVRKNLRDILVNLVDRADKHDRSKLEEPEKSMFDEWTPKLRASTYGTPEYEKMCEGMGEALFHHYANNQHHPEHWAEGKFDEINQINFLIDRIRNENLDRYPIPFLERYRDALISRLNNMSLLDIIEMLADWKAATMRHSDGDIIKSLEINRTRFKISDQLYHILVNTVKELGWDK